LAAIDLRHKTIRIALAGGGFVRGVQTSPFLYKPFATLRKHFVDPRSTEFRHESQSHDSRGSTDQNYRKLPLLMDALSVFQERMK